MHSSAYLDALILVPLLGSLAVMLIRRSFAFPLAAAIAGAELVLAVVVGFLYDDHVPGAATVDFASRHVLSAPFGLAYDVGLDGISLLLMVLTAVVLAVSVLGARESHRERSFLAWLLVLGAVTMAGFLSRDVLEFFIFFELTLVPSFFIVADWGGAERARAALKFFLYTFSGSAFFFVGLLYLGHLHQLQSGGAITFAYGALASTAMSHGTAVWLFVAFAIAFAIKSPLFPFHTWSPLTYAEAPTAGSMELSAVLAKLGSYGLLRFAVGLFPLALVSMRPWLLTIAVISIFYGSLVACATPDLKRLVTYSSLAQMGFITLGALSGSAIAVEGSVLLMFNHGVITAGFFLLIGYIERRRGSYQIKDLTGLQGPAPVLAALFTLVMLASIGLPGLSGFVSEYLVLIGTFSTHVWWAAAATPGVVAAAAYLLWAYQRVFHGRAEGPNVITDVSTAERWAIVPIVVLIVALGVFPRPVLDRIAPSVDQLVHHVTTTSSHQGTP